MRYRILPYRQGSKGAKALADALQGRVLKLNGSTFTPTPGDVVINWGQTTRPDNLDTPSAYLNADFLNEPQEIRAASNKRLFFERMRDAGYSDLIPTFWTSRDDIPGDAFPIVCRTVLAGHSGDGIVISDSHTTLVQAPLYVQYIKKEAEYRVHVGKRGEEFKIIAVQRKARRLETPDNLVNWKVRNHANGFVYVRGGFTAPNAVIEAAKISLEATGLDFGACDVLFNAQQQRAYVLEINTAPGLEGQTVQDYAAFFKGE